MKQYFKRNWKMILNVFTFILLGVTIYFLRSDIAKVFDDLGKVNAVFLLTIPIWQVLNYSSYAHMYQSFLKILGRKLDDWLMFKVALEMNFVNHVLPSGGVSGFSYFAVRLKDHGVTGAQATLTQTIRFALTFTSYIVLLFIGLILLALGGSASNLLILITCSLAFLTLFSVLVGAYVISDEGRIHSFTQNSTKVLNKFLQIIRPKHPETIKLKKVGNLFSDLHKNYLKLKGNAKELRTPLIYATLANITELATIYSVYLAYGHAVNPGAVIIAYAVANFAGLIAVLPGGVGVYEALMTIVMVSAGVPAALSISVTVMYRVLTMVFGLLPGYYFYHKALNQLDSKAPANG